MASQHQQTEVSIECPLRAGIMTSAPTTSSQQRRTMTDMETTDTVESSASAPAAPPAVVLEPYMRKIFEWNVEQCSRLVSATEGPEATKKYFRRSKLFRFMRRTWYLQLYPNRAKAMRLYLFLLEGCLPVTVKHSFGIRTVRGNIEWKSHMICNFGSEGERKYNTAKNIITKVELANRMADLAKDDVLTIVCNLLSEECIKFLEGFVYKSEEYIPRHLLPESRPWDLTFHVQNRIMVVDSAILRLHCPYLASQMEPGKSHRVDYDPWVYRQFLLYLYTGKVVNMHMEQLILLYVLAKRNQVTALRERCVCLMTVYMDIENVIPLLDFAERAAETDLVAVIRKFVVKHTMQVISTQQWMKFIKEKPDEANRLYIHIAENYMNAMRLVKSLPVPSGSTETSSISH